jgi:hypothetical protein
LTKTRIPSAYTSATFSEKGRWHGRELPRIPRWFKTKEGGRCGSLETAQGFQSALGAIYQTFGGEELYPDLEEKAANQLYFIEQESRLQRRQQEDWHRSLHRISCCKRGYLPR